MFGIPHQSRHLLWHTPLHIGHTWPSCLHLRGPHMQLPSPWISRQHLDHLCSCQDASSLLLFCMLSWFALYQHFLIRLGCCKNLSCKDNETQISLGLLFQRMSKKLQFIYENHWNVKGNNVLCNMHDIFKLGRYQYMISRLNRFKTFNWIEFECASRTPFRVNCVPIKPGMGPTID